MLNYSFINSLDGLKFTEKTYDKFCIPLFHGTRKHLLDMSNEERDRFYSVCKRILNYLKDLSNNCPSLLNELIEFDFIIRKKGYSRAGAVCFKMYGRSARYEYGDFYMTISPKTALDFSKTTNGELGDLAYFAGLFLIYSKKEISRDLKDDIDLIISYHDKYIDDERIILMLSNADFDDLFIDNGKPFRDRYVEENDIQKYFDDYFNNVLSSQSFSTPNHYRLVNLSKYNFYAIKESMLGDLEKVITTAFLGFYINKSLEQLKDKMDIVLSWDNSYTSPLDTKDYDLKFKDKDGNVINVILESDIFSNLVIELDYKIRANEISDADKRIILRICYNILINYVSVNKYHI